MKIILMSLLLLISFQSLASCPFVELLPQLENSYFDDSNNLDAICQSYGYSQYCGEFSYYITVSGDHKLVSFSESDEQKEVPTAIESILVMSEEGHIALRKGDQLKPLLAIGCE